MHAALTDLELMKQRGCWMSVNILLECKEGVKHEERFKTNK